MAGYIPSFEAGDVARAADFSALVAVVRELMAAHGLVGVRRCSGRVRRMFTPAGAGVIRFTADGTPVAGVAEMLWQCGPHVGLLPGGVAAGVVSALAEAGGAVPVGVHAEVTMARHETAAAAETLEATGASYAAAAWHPAQDFDDGSVEYAAHGAGLAGCQQVAADARGKWQAALTMWPMPQVPLCVCVQPGVQVDGGSEVLLPGGAQVLAAAPGGYYGEAGGRNEVQHEWCGELDRWGQLRFSTRNFEIEGE